MDIGGRLYSVIPLLCYPVFFFFFVSFEFCVAGVLQALGD